jgi:hypothetical protein
MFLILLTILQSLFSTIEQKTLLTEFSMTQTQVTATSTQAPITYTGNMKMRGECFTLSMLSMDAAYDGKTLYVYSEEAEELTLSNPTSLELTESNPILFAKALLPVCKYEEKVVGDKTQIFLTPNNQTSGIKKYVLQVVTTTLLPVSIEIHETSGSITTVRLNNAKYTQETPSFQIVKQGVFINDLR